MHFEETGFVADEIRGEDLGSLVSESLCGQTRYGPLTDSDLPMLDEFIARAKADGLDCATFNELLLVLNQDRVSEDFFKLFFGERASLHDLLAGITRFRGFAMLAFGNFLFAFRRLRLLSNEDLLKGLDPFIVATEALTSELENRLPQALTIEEIDRNKTWYAGYIAKTIYESDAKWVEQELKSAPDGEQLLQLADAYAEMGEEIGRVEDVAIRNTDIYLTWDHLDVYIATSMRRRWEFAETFDFVHELFDQPLLKALNLRWFDPTQSLCRHRIDKGLTEALMLKRARCTIYMAQEVDSMGKDSELAATLAQGKPVIAYVPRIDIETHAEKLAEYSIGYFQRRFPILRVEGILADAQCQKDLRSASPSFNHDIDGFLQRLANYREGQPLELWKDRDEGFKEGLGEDFPLICRLLAIAERCEYDKRANVLQGVHPLSLQVGLDTGVANGVLVVRNLDECAAVLKGVLLNDLSFRIKHEGPKHEGMTVLEELVSECPFRVVTDYERLTNSFWNFWN